MYAVTAEYAENIAKTVRYTGVTGYVQAKSGTSYPITDDNISANSLVIKRALNKRGDYRPGGVAAAEMSIGLLGFGDLADNLNGARIVLFFDLYRTAAMEEYDRVPLGVFFVDGSQIKRKYSTVKLKAYDGMLKFDIAASALTGTLYELLETACAACGVYLDITQEEFEALPNGTMTVTIDTARIQTWRDFLMYVGLLTGCWCRMRRDSPNELEIVKLTCERDENSIIQVQRNIAGDNRFSTEFSDDKIYITKLSTRHNGSLVEQTRKITWVGENITMLAQLELVENPLLRNKTEDEVVEALNNIIIQITQCALRTFSTDFNGDPALDVGDYVQLDGGAIDIKQNSTGSGFENGYIRVFITSQVWRYRGKHRLECKLPTLMEANATAATLADEDSEEPMRVTPKSQIEKRLDGIEAQLGDLGGWENMTIKTPTTFEDGWKIASSLGPGEVHGNYNEVGLVGMATEISANYNDGITLQAGNTERVTVNSSNGLQVITSGSQMRINFGNGNNIIINPSDLTINLTGCSLALSSEGLRVNGTLIT